MKLVKSLTTASALSLIMLGNAGAADAPRGLQPLFGNFLADTDPGNGSPWNAGLEVAVPYFKLNDTSPADGYPESVSVSFRIYAKGTTTLKYITPAKLVLTPAIPSGCTDPNQFEFDWNPGFARRLAQLDSSGAFVDEAKRMHVGLNMEVNCFNGNNWVWSDSAGVYSANLSGVAGTGNPVASWSRSFAGKFLFGLNGIDTDNNLVTDQLTLTTVSGPENNENATVYIVNAGTGANITVNTYPLVR
jgi:hypothetical protein